MGGARGRVGHLGEGLAGWAGTVGGLLRAQRRAVAALAVAQVAELVQHRAVLGKHQQQRQNPGERQAAQLLTTLTAGRGRRV